MKFWTPLFVLELVMNLIGFGILLWFAESMKWPWYSSGVLYIGIDLAGFRTHAPRWWTK